jgi:hypothetical protein
MEGYRILAPEGVRDGVKRFLALQLFPGGAARPCTIHRVDYADHLRASWFDLERTIARRVDHPRVLRIVGAGELNDASFYAAERPRGAALAAILKKHPAPFRLSSVVAVGLAVAEALAYFHEFTAAGQTFRIPYRLTAEEVWIGRDRSISLEPLRLSSEETADERRDLSALGMIMLQMLGRDPLPLVERIGRVRVPVLRFLLADLLLSTEACPVAPIAERLRALLHGARTEVESDQINPAPAAAITTIAPTTASLVRTLGLAGLRSVRDRSKKVERSSI